MQFFYWKNWLFNFGLLSLVIISFCFYAPCFYKLYNSDHAIHALMSYDFELPRDLFYWGQNRLGSLLPMLTYPFVKLFKVQPLYMVSIIHYVQLLISVLVLSKFINNNWIKFALFLAVFLPVTEYRAILWIGHPYSQQLFCGTLFLYFCHLFYDGILIFSGENTYSKKPLKLFLHEFLLFLFFGLGVWVSELSAILILIPLLFLIFDRKRSFPALKNKHTYPYIVLGIGYTIGLYFLLSYIKHLFPKDPTYDKPFFFEPDKIKLQFAYMKANISDVFLMRDDRLVDNLFYYAAILILGIFFFTRKKKDQSPIKYFIRATLLTCGTAFILLFFSTWNLRSTFCTRYYIPVYYLLVVAFLFAVDTLTQKKALIGIVAIFISFTTYHSIAYLNHNKGPGPYTRFSDFKKLPKGTLIAGYWDSYLIGSVTTRNIIPITFDHDFNRNGFIMEKALNNTNFYFINSPELPRFIRNDTIWQYAHAFVYMGKKYNCNGMEVLQYFKVR